MKYLGKDNVSALMTVTRSSLNNLNDVIDEYERTGLSSIFIRMINQHGYAIDEWCNVGYSVEEFLAAYEKALNHIIVLNKSGIFFAEEYATLILTKILTPFCTGFVDLQSPSGAGIGGAIYEINGDVFIADEARMLAKKTGDKTFCIGNAFKDSYESMFCGKKLFEFASATTIEAIPGCAWCVYQPYCGSDPIRNYIQFGNYGNNQSKTDFCKKQKAIFDILFKYLKSNEDSTIDVFWSWVTRRDLSEIIIDNPIKQ